MKYDRYSIALDFKKEIESQLKVSVESNGDILLSRGLFRDTVDIKFADHSNVHFKYASVVTLGGGNMLILTEHCGYHVFRVSVDDEISITPQ